MKGLIIGAIIGLLLGLTLITIDGWKTLPDDNTKGLREVIYGGMKDREKGEQIIYYEEWKSSQPIQIFFKFGLLVFGLGLGLGIGSFFEEEDNENNNTKT